MTAEEVHATVASRPSEDWLKIQAGITEMLTARFSSDKTADAEFARGKAMTGAEVRSRLGLV